MAKAPAKKPKDKAAADTPPDVELHDEVYFRHPKGPKCGKVLSRGEHGCVIEADGERHKVRWGDMHGHKVRVRPEVKVVDEGEDGMLVEDATGRRRYVHDPVGAIAPTMAKARGPVVLMMGTHESLLKATRKGAPGLTLQNVTDKAGHATKRWKKSGAEQPKKREAAAADDGAGSAHGYGTHNLGRGDHVAFKMGTLEGEGEIVSAGEVGATVKDSEGHPHKVRWEHVTGHKGGSSDASKVHAAKTAAEPNKPVPRDAGHAEGSAFSDLPPAGVEALVSEVDRAVAAAKMSDLFSGPDTDALPAKVSSSLTSWEDIAGKQAEAQSGLQTMLEGIAGSVGGRNVGRFTDDNLSEPGIVYGLGPPKDRVSAERKVNDKYAGDWSKLGDAVRASIGFDSVDQLRDGIDKLKAAGLKLATKPDNKFVNPTDAGYRDMNLNFEMPNGVVGELQLHLKPILRAKSQGHKDYDVTRILSAKERNDPPLSPNETQELKDRLMRQRVLYTRAMQEALGSK